jgi:hypothetical protein
LANLRHGGATAGRVIDLEVRTGATAIVLLGTREEYLIVWRTTHSGMVSGWKIERRDGRKLGVAGGSMVWLSGKTGFEAWAGYPHMPAGWPQLADLVDNLGLAIAVEEELSSRVLPRG